MPNWTTNAITLKHEDKSKIDLIANIDPNDTGILQTLIPCPEELCDDDLTSWSRGPEQDARDKKKAEMVKKYGYESWYDWRVANWGTKWDLCDPTITRVDDNTVMINCQTAWSPPDVALSTLVSEGYDVRALYVGEGYEYAGIWDNGNDEYYNNLGNSQNALATLPQELDDEFDISAGLAEYELEEETEELTEWIKDGVEAKEKA